MTEMPAREFDLRLRVAPGTERRYRCREVFDILDEGGTPARREERTAVLQTAALGNASDGSPRMRWTFATLTYTVDGAQVNDPDVLPEAGVSTFDGAPERPGSAMLPFESLGFSTSSVAAWMSVELMLHLWGLQVMATSTHGGIDRLRRLGDESLMPWSGTRDHAVFGTMIDITLHRAESRLRFDGLTVKSGRDAGLLSCSTGYELEVVGLGPGRADVGARLWIDLATGELLAGEAKQCNYISSVPRPDGTSGPMNHVIATFLDPIDA